MSVSTEVLMDRAEYLSAVNEFYYQGEVLGEAFFGRCFELETDPMRGYKWANLQQLETETKAKLRPYLMRLGVSIVQEDMSGKVAEFSQGFEEKSWSQHMKMIAEVTTSTLANSARSPLLRRVASAIWLR
jgi:hypothetical protein